MLLAGIDSLTGNAELYVLYDGYVMSYCSYIELSWAIVGNEGIKRIE